jgi:hypothetical protein
LYLRSPDLDIIDKLFLHGDCLTADGHFRFLEHHLHVLHNNLSSMESPVSQIKHIQKLNKLNIRFCFTSYSLCKGKIWASAVTIFIFLVNRGTLLWKRIVFIVESFPDALVCTSVLQSLHTENNTPNSNPIKSHKCLQACMQHNFGSKVSLMTSCTFQGYFSAHIFGMWVPGHQSR